MSESKTVQFKGTDYVVQTSTAPPCKLQYALYEVVNEIVSASEFTNKTWVELDDTGNLLVDSQ